MVTRAREVYNSSASNLNNLQGEVHGHVGSLTATGGPNGKAGYFTQSVTGAKRHQEFWAVAAGEIWGREYDGSWGDWKPLGGGGGGGSAIPVSLGDTQLTAAMTSLKFLDNSEDINISNNGGAVEVSVGPQLGYFTDPLKLLGGPIADLSEKRLFGFTAESNTFPPQDGVGNVAYAMKGSLPARCYFSVKADSVPTAQHSTILQFVIAKSESSLEASGGSTVIMAAPKSILGQSGPGHVYQVQNGTGGAAPEANLSDDTNIKIGVEQDDANVYLHINGNRYLVANDGPYTYVAGATFAATAEKTIAFDIGTDTSHFVSTPAVPALDVSNVTAPASPYLKNVLSSEDIKVDSPSPGVVQLEFQPTVTTAGMRIRGTDGKAMHADGDTVANVNTRPHEFSLDPLRMGVGHYRVTLYDDSQKLQLHPVITPVGAQLVKTRLDVSFRGLNNHFDVYTYNDSNQLIDSDFLMTVHGLASTDSKKNRIFGEIYGMVNSNMTLSTLPADASTFSDGFHFKFIYMGAGRDDKIKMGGNSIITSGSNIILSVDDAATAPFKAVSMSASNGYRWNVIDIQVKGGEQKVWLNGALVSTLANTEFASKWNNSWNLVNFNGWFERIEIYRYDNSTWDKKYHWRVEETFGVRGPFGLDSGARIPNAQGTGPGTIADIKSGPQKYAGIEGSKIRSQDDQVIANFTTGIKL